MATLRPSNNNNNRGQEMMACFSALDSESQDMIIRMASRRRSNLEMMMQETGLDKDAAGARYDMWISAKTGAMLAKETRKADAE